MTTNGEHVERSWELAARAGYGVSGVLHVLVGLLALQLAFGSSSQEADQSGALRAMAATPFGAAVLWFAVVAFFALGAWQVAKAIHVGAASEQGSSGSRDRAKAAGRALVYVALAFTSLALVRGGGQTSSDQQATDLTARLMAEPGGRLLVGAIGLAILGVGIYHVVKGLRQTFLRDLTRLPSGTTGRVVRWLGVAGYVAKGVALAVVGVLFVTASVQADPERAGGLDDALHALRSTPAGPIVLVVVALGFVAFGAYSFTRARFGRI